MPGSMSGTTVKTACSVHMASALMGLLENHNNNACQSILKLCMLLKYKICYENN